MPTDIKSAIPSFERASDRPGQGPPSRLGSTTPYAIAVTALLLVFAVLVFAPLRSSQRFNYDESDYMYAVSKGFLANYLDNPTLSPATFIKKGLQAVRPANWAQLSEFARQSDDIALYRHYHGPLHFYSILLARAFLGNASERSFRLVPFAALLACAVVLFVGSVLVVPNHGGVTGCLCCLFLLTSPTNIETARWLTPHTLYIATALVALFMMAKLVQSRDLRYLYASVIFIGIAFTAIEYAVLLVITLLVTMFVDRPLLAEVRKVGNPYKIAITCISLFLATVTVLWPGGIFKLTLVKDYLFFLYFSTVRSAAAYGTSSLARVWALRAKGSPLEATVLVIFCGLFLWKLLRKQYTRYLLPFAVYAALVALTVFRNRSSSPSYISSLLPPLCFVTAALIADLLHRHRRAGYLAIALVTSAFIINGYAYAYRPLLRVETSNPTDNVVEVLNNSREGQKLLVPHNYVPTIHYYHPFDKLTAYPDDWTADQLAHKCRVAQFDGVVYIGRDYKSLRDLVQTSGVPAISVRLNSDGSEVAFVPVGSYALQ